MDGVRNIDKYRQIFPVEIHSLSIRDGLYIYWDTPTYGWKYGWMGGVRSSGLISYKLELIEYNSILFEDI